MIASRNGHGRSSGNGNGNGNGQGHIERVLTTLTRPHLLQAIAVLQRRQDHAEVMLGLLQHELHRRLSAPPKHQDETFLTVKDVARELRLTRRYIYDLIKQGELRAMMVPGSKGYVRVSRDSVTAFIKENLQKKPDF